jgi:hypothetical protein
VVVAVAVVLLEAVLMVAAEAVKYTGPDLSMLWPLSV